MAFSEQVSSGAGDPASSGAVDPWAWRPAAPALIEEPVWMLRLEGPDSLRFLHGQSSQDLERARPGQWLSTCCITPTARMRALAEVLVDEQGAWLVITAGDAVAVRQALDRVLFPADRVRLGDLLEGRLVRLLDEDRAPAATDTWTSLAGQQGWSLGAAMLLLPEGAPLPEIQARRRRLSEQDRERWRIQRGQPAASTEISDETNPFELGLAGRVSLTKGCYVGQETLARLATYDGVRQQLRRWCASAPPGDATGAAAAAALAPGALLRDPKGERAGRITSTLFLGEGAGWIGLALVRRPWLAADGITAGDGADAVALTFSLPEEFQPPPTGAGSGGPNRGPQGGGGDSRGGAQGESS